MKPCSQQTHDKYHTRSNKGTQVAVWSISEDKIIKDNHWNYLDSFKLEFENDELVDSTIFYDHIEYKNGGVSAKCHGHNPL